MKIVIEMAQEAGFDYSGVELSWESVICTEELERFAELVRADEREKYKWDVHSCGPTCERYACVAMREAVKAEREACAKVADSEADGWHPDSNPYSASTAIADAIRARGNT